MTPDLVVKTPVFTFSLLRLETRSKGITGVGLSQAAENPPSLFLTSMAPSVP